MRFQSRNHRRDRGDDDFDPLKMPHPISEAPDIELASLFRTYAELKGYTPLDEEGMQHALDLYKAGIENFLFGTTSDENGIVRVGPDAVPLKVDFRSGCATQRLRPALLVICRRVDEDQQQSRSRRSKSEVSHYKPAEVVLPCLTDRGGPPVSIGRAGGACGLIVEPRGNQEEWVLEADDGESREYPSLTMLMPRPMMRELIKRFTSGHFNEALGDYLRSRIEQLFSAPGLNITKAIEGRQRQSDSEAKLLIFDGSGAKYLAEVGPDVVMLNGKEEDLDTFMIRFVVPVGGRYPSPVKVAQAMEEQRAELLTLRRTALQVPDNPHLDYETLPLGMESWFRTGHDRIISFPHYPGSPAQISKTADLSADHPMYGGRSPIEVDTEAREAIEAFLRTEGRFPRFPREFKVDWHLRAVPKATLECEWYLVSVHDRNGSYFVFGEGDSLATDPGFCGLWIQRNPKTDEQPESLKILARVLSDDLVEREVRNLAATDPALRKYSLFYGQAMRALVQQLTFHLPTKGTQLDDFHLDDVGIASLHDAAHGLVVHLILCSHDLGHSLLHVTRHMGSGICYNAPEGVGALDLFPDRKRRPSG